MATDLGELIEDMPRMGRKPEADPEAMLLDTAHDNSENGPEPHVPRKAPEPVMKPKEQPSKKAEEEVEKPEEIEKTEETSEDSSEDEEALPEQSEVELLREQCARLQTLLNVSAAERFNQGTTISAAPQRSAEIPGITSARTVAKPPAPFVISDEKFEAIIGGDKASFQDVLNEAVQRGRQQVLSEVGGIASDVFTTNARISAFFGNAENADVKPLMSYVIAEGLRVDSEKPGLTIEQSLAEAANRVRQDIGMTLKSARPEPKRKSKVPAGQFPKRGAGRRSLAPAMAASSEESQVARDFDEFRRLR